MTNETEAVRAEPFAWMIRNNHDGSAWIDEVCVWESNVEAVDCAADMNENIDGAEFEAVAVYTESEIDRLTGEVESLRTESARIEKENIEGWKQAAHWRAKVEAAERRATELTEAARRTIRAFELLGSASGIVRNVQARHECESAMVSLKSILTQPEADHG